MQINNDKKIDILIDLLNEKYEDARKMRERSLNFAIWILGFGIAISWLLLSEIILILSQKIILTLFVIIIGFLTKSFLKAIEVGFDKNRKVIISIEESLGCYEENVYMDAKSLFPVEYRGQSKKETSHFASLYKWLLTVGIVIISLIWI